MKNDDEDGTTGCMIILVFIIFPLVFKIFIWGANKIVGYFSREESIDILLLVAIVWISVIALPIILFKWPKK